MSFLIFMALVVLFPFYWMLNLISVKSAGGIPP